MPGYLVDLDHALKRHFGDLGDKALAQARGHRLDIVLIQVQFPGDLEIGEVQPHEIQAQYPDPERLMMPSQDRPSQVIKADAAAFATVALAVPLLLVMTITDHRMARTTGTAHAIGPTMLTDQLVALVVCNERSEVDQLRGSHDDTESARN
ncbi:MAG: hypothetical protein WCC64_00300 [Aliidongia sp.]